MQAMYNGQYHAVNDLSRTMRNRGLGPLGTSILEPFYVIYAFGSMLSCILCKRQTYDIRLMTFNFFRNVSFAC